MRFIHPTINCIYMSNEQQNNRLWRIAKQRAAFKQTLASYVIINGLLVAIWYFTIGPYGYFWPIWSILGWGIGVAIQYMQAYHGSSLFSAEEEYKRLVEEEDKKL